jgi:hypothetical protein
MTLRARRLAPFAALVLAVSIASSVVHPAFAQSHGTEASPQARAQEHFKRAKDLYLSGSYREAEGELLAASALDPKARDLVFNMAIVSEKLGKIDNALAYLHHYEEMDLTASERARADASIRRLEGAKREVVPPTPLTTLPEPPPPAPPSHGRVDAATITFATIAVLGFAAGGVFGAKALSDKPPANYVTGPGGNGSYADLTNAVSTSHREAVICDASLGGAAAATIVTAILFFARTNDPSDDAPPATTSHALTATPVAMAHGGAFVLGGSF